MERRRALTEDYCTVEEVEREKEKKGGVVGWWGGGERGGLNCIFHSRCLETVEDLLMKGELGVHGGRGAALRKEKEKK